MGRTQGRQLLLTKRSKARPLLDDFGQILIPFTILFGRLWVIFWHNFAGGVLGGLSILGGGGPGPATGHE